MTDADATGHRHGETDRRFNHDVPRRWCVGAVVGVPERWDPGRGWGSRLTADKLIVVGFLQQLMDVVGGFGLFQKATKRFVT